MIRAWKHSLRRDDSPPSLSVQAPVNLDMDDSCLEAPAAQRRFAAFSWRVSPPLKASCRQRRCDNVNYKQRNNRPCLFIVKRRTAHVQSSVAPSNSSVTTIYNFCNLVALWGQQSITFVT